MRNPFTEFSPSTENLLGLQEEEELSELQCDRTLKMKFSFSLVSIDKFWISAKQEYLFVSGKALDVLLLFSASYLCEQAFSCLTVIKSKSRNCRLSVEEELRMSIKNLAKTFTDTQRETSPSVTLKVSFNITDVLV